MTPLVVDYRVWTITWRFLSLTTVSGPKHDAFCPWLPCLDRNMTPFNCPWLPCLDRNMTPFILDYRVWTKTWLHMTLTTVSGPKHDAFRLWLSCLDQNMTPFVLDYRIWTETWRSASLTTVLDKNMTFFFISTPLKQVRSIHFLYTCKPQK